MQRKTRQKSGSGTGNMLSTDHTGLQEKLDFAVQQHRAGKLQKARKVYKKILKASPQHADALHMLGLLEHQSGNNATAINLFHKAAEAGPASAEIYTNLGNALQVTGNFNEAINAFQRAIEINPGFALAHNNLGNALRATGDSDAAAASFRHAIRISPNYALAYFNLGELLHAGGSLDKAIAAIRHAILLDPGLAAAHSSLATLLMEKGDVDESRILFKQAIKLDPNDAVAKHMLAAQEGQTTRSAPPGYVVGLFDGCAEYFDRQLVDGLGYRAPQDLYDAVAEHIETGRTELDIVDLGCGTGLCGPLFSGVARTLTGIDLSPRMLEQARERNVYDTLVQGDITDVLLSSATTYDLVLAADVFIYVGALEKLFDAVASVLKPGGLLAFSLEAEDDCDGFVLRPTGRYAHSMDYIRRLAEATGLREVHLVESALRMDKGQSIDGYIVVLGKPGADKGSH